MNNSGSSSGNGDNQSLNSAINLSKPTAMSTFLGISGGMFGAGMVYGVYRVIKKEKIIVDMKVHRPGILMAARALGWGTVLCMGISTLTASLFSSYTGINNLDDLGKSLKTAGDKIHLSTGKIDVNAPENKKQNDEAEKQFEEFFDSLSKGSNSNKDKNE